MLTDDLVRYRIDGDRILPRYIMRKRAGEYLGVAGKLFQIVRSHTGKTRRELDDFLENMEGERVDFKVIRGLAKLLIDECVFLPKKEMDYSGLRKCIFQAVQKHYPVVTRPDLLYRKTRDQVLEELSAETGLSSDELDSLLYADLEENLILTRFDTGLTPETLLKRYNLALAQGILYHAVGMEIVLKSDFRAVFQHLKLCGLMHWILPNPEGGYKIAVDGAASLFRNTQRYGVRMARFLPGLLLASDWEMLAQIQNQRGTKLFFLDSACGLTTHYKTIPQFDSLIEEHFFEKFTRRDRGWAIERENELIDLGDAVFIPDFTFRHPDGRVAHMEIVGYWTPEYLEKKLDKIRRAGRSNLFLAVNNQLNCGREDFPGEVLWYRTGIKIGEVLEMAEKVGTIPGQPLKQKD